MEGLSDEAVCARWVENPYYQFFCGEQFFRHKLVLDRSSMTRWRRRIGAERLELLLAETLSVAMRTKATTPQACERVLVAWLTALWRVLITLLIAKIQPPLPAA